MGTDKPTTFWVSRDEDRCLVLWRNSPRNRDGNFVDHREASDALDEFSVEAWPALGLPKEPKKGMCFEITWDERYVLSKPQHFDDGEYQLVPIARDVTDELKESSNAS